MKCSSYKVLINYHEATILNNQDHIKRLGNFVKGQRTIDARLTHTSGLLNAQLTYS